MVEETKDTKGTEGIEETKDTDVDTKDSQTDNKGQQESGEDDQEKNEKLFTQADIDKIINKKFAAWKQKQEEDKKEAERQATMTAEEKLEHERKQLEAERKQLEYEKMVTNTSKNLTKQGLPAEFADFLVGENQEATDNRIEVFKKAFEDAVAKSVSEKFKNPSPKASASDNKATGGITREEFSKMTMVQMAKLKEEKPQVYAELTKHLR